MVVHAAAIHMATVSCSSVDGRVYVRMDGRVTDVRLPWKQSAAESLMTIMVGTVLDVNTYMGVWFMCLCARFK